MAGRETAAQARDRSPDGKKPSPPHENGPTTSNFRSSLNHPNRTEKHHEPRQHPAFRVKSAKMENDRGDIVDL